MNLKLPFLLMQIIALTICCTSRQAQTQNLPIPLNVQRTYANNIRTTDGKPGANYWQNRSDYTIDANFNPVTRLVKGEEKISYTNNSPDTIHTMVIRLYQDIFKKGNIRNEAVQPTDLHNGVDITHLSVNNKEIPLAGPGVLVIRTGTNLIFQLAQPLLPKTKVELEVEWNYTVPKETNIREGTYDASSYFIAYWYPQVSVYDAIDGWDRINYVGEQEFYNDFGNYDVSITVPSNFIVWATGLLQNPDEVLSKEYINRLKKAQTSDQIITIISADDIKKGGITLSKDQLTWKFKAEWVPDFAFATSDHYLWDATSINVDPKTKRRVTVGAAYKAQSKDFYEVAAIGRKTVEYLSNDIPGIPFPYPHITVFNGHGGMEFPMMANNGSTYSKTATELVTSHEIAHTYFPFYMGINERKYAWMDEGWADFLERSSIETNTISKSYIKKAGTIDDIPPMIPSVYMKEPAYGFAAYVRPSMAYTMLHDYLGDKKFKKALKEYIHRWNGKHPIPFDFFYTFNDVAGEDLSWFWKPWFFEQGYPDLAIGSVNKEKSKTLITIEKKGNIPVPVTLKITFEDGSEQIIHEKASIWKDQKTNYTLAKSFNKPIKKIILGDNFIPDTNPIDNTWIKK